jgi:hypothetical protein
MRSIVIAAAVGLVGVLSLTARLQAQQPSTPGAPESPHATLKLVTPMATTVQYGSGVLTSTVFLRLGRPEDKLTFTVSNKTKHPIDYEFNSGEQFDVEITDSMAKEVWSLSKSRLFPRLMTRLSLKPGESRKYICQWNRRDNDDRPVAPGAYTATATLMAMPKFVVTGTALVDVHRDQDNPTRSGPLPPPGIPDQMEVADGGSVVQTDITPPVQAKTTIIVSR